MSKQSIKKNFIGAWQKVKTFFALPPKISKEERKSWNNSQKIKFYRMIAWRILIVALLLVTIMNLYVVGITNHILFQNTKNFERFSAFYQVPDWYSLSEMKVDIDSTYYTIKKVVPVFNSVGTQFSIGSGILTQGLSFKFYKEIYPSVLTSVIFLAFEFITSLSSIEGIRFRMRYEGIFGKIFWLSLVLNILLILQMLFPLFG